MSSPERVQCSVFEQLAQLHAIIGDRPFTIDDLSPDVCATLGHAHPSTLHTVIIRAADDGEIITREQEVAISADEETIITYSWRPIPQFSRAHGNKHDLPMFSSVGDMLKDLTPDETAALELLADCDLEMDLPTRIRSANKILRLMKPNERNEFADRMFAGGVFTRHGRNPRSPCGVIWALQPTRLMHVLQRREELDRQTTADTMKTLATQIQDLSLAQESIATDQSIATSQLDDLKVQRDNLTQEMRRIKQRLAEVNVDASTWDIASKHLSAQAQEVSAELTAKTAELEALKASEIQKQQKELDDILDKIDSLSPAQLEDLRNRISS